MRVGRKRWAKVSLWSNSVQHVANVSRHTETIVVCQQHTEIVWKQRTASLLQLLSEKSDTTNAKTQALEVFSRL